MRWNATTPDADAKSSMDRTIAAITVRKSPKREWNPVSVRAAVATSPVARLGTPRPTRRVELSEPVRIYRKELQLADGLLFRSSRERNASSGMRLALRSKDTSVPGGEK